MVATSCSRLIDSSVVHVSFAATPPRRPVFGSPQRRRTLPASRMKATLDKLKQGLQGNGEPSAQGLSVRKRCLNIAQSAAAAHSSKSIA